jgi:hypothetical protein
MKLQITFKDGNKSLLDPITADFDGHAVLFGGDEDISIPPELEDLWRRQVGKRLDIFYMWAQPTAPREFAIPVAPMQRIEISLLQKDQRANAYKPYGDAITVIIERPRRSRTFVQEIVLYGPNENLSIN